jgi:hypothetical protein
MASLLSPSLARADLLSPGDLAAPHAPLDGVSNCTQCHSGGDQLSPDACLSCHVELKPRIDAGRGWHGRLKGEERNCEKCHHEHQGRDYAMVVWKGGKNAFDHRETGWTLNGGHRKPDCARCHDTRLVTDGAVRNWLSAHPQMKGTFLGLSRECASCHFDEHRGQESPKCDSCHEESRWTSVPRFDHQKTGFSLVGRHQKVACDKCHAPVDDPKTPANTFPAPRAGKFLKLKEIPHANCTDCHKDPHSGSFGQTCSSCHTAEDWKRINAGTTDRAFHDNTRYPLRGAHTDVACASCHPGTPMKTKPIPSEACSDCHVDAHQRQVTTKSGEVEPCEHCHTVEAFKPARFTPKDHERTAYPLEGKHAQVNCELCHAEDRRLAGEVPAKVRVSLRKAHRKELFSTTALRLPASRDGCLGCHADGHGGQLKVGDALRRCEDCHAVASFSPSRYELEDHAKSRYPLDGAHQVVACDACHRPSQEPGKEIPPTMQALVKRGGHVLLSNLVMRPEGAAKGCVGCHADIHGGQFAERVARSGCEACHVNTSFTDLKKFAHDRDSAYPLIGKHANAPCVGCHIREPINGDSRVRYRPLDSSCAGCHPDIHVGQFADASGATDCARCHTTQDFRTTSFAHAPPFTNYLLEGRHTTLKCESCHRPVAIGAGAQVVRYRPLPTKCQACHVDQHDGSLKGVRP